MTETALNKDQQQAIAIAGMIYSAYCVETLAKQGKHDQNAREPLLHSLFQFDAPSTEAIYGDRYAMRKGLELLVGLLSGDLTSSHPDTMRYTLGIAVLERKARPRNDLMEIIHNRLEHIQFKYEHLDSDFYDLAQSVSGIYQDTLSTLNFRIQVTGDPARLRDTQVADQVRCFLMCGFRSALLWNQLGGKRWHFLTRRQRLLKAAKSLM